MPLTLLGPIVAIGLALIALALWVMGFGNTPPLDKDAVSRAIAREFDVPPSDILFSPDERAALVQTPVGPLIAWRMGADVALRRLGRARCETTDGGLRFHFDDLAAPPLTVPLPQEARAAWEARLT